MHKDREIIRSGVSQKGQVVNSSSYILLIRLESVHWLL